MKEKLKPLSNLDEYFSNNEICGKKMHLLEMGTVNFPTGEIIVRDPLVYLTRDANPYFIKAPTGIFPLLCAVVEVEENHYRYAAVKVSFNGNNKAAYYVEALVGNENLDELKDGEYFGFGVDAGLGTIVDVETKNAYYNFIEKWEQEHPDKEIYDDFFAEEFKKSYEKNPQYQRKDGDWINFLIPDTNLTIPMFQSGWGDGAYPMYFGYDKDNKVCEVVIQFIDIKLVFSKKE